MLFRSILLNTDLKERRRNESIDIHYLDSGGTTFSFVTCVSFPGHLFLDPQLAFSADGSKFAVAVSRRSARVAVWNIQSKTPLKTFVEVPKYGGGRHIGNLQFSSGKSGKEALVFVEVCPMFTF